MNNSFRRVLLSLFLWVGLPGSVLAASPVPKKPFPGQKLPPCDGEYDREIHGACWMVLEAMPGPSRYNMPETCAQWDTWELEPGHCLWKKQIVVPVWKEPLNNS